MSKNLRNLSGRKGLDDNLFEHLGEQGAPSEETLQNLADKYLIGNSSTYGAASFYDFLNPEKAGKKAFVCNGSACLLAGTQDKLKKDLEGQLGEGCVGDVYCLGRCYENKAFHTNGKNFSGADASRLPEAIQPKAESTAPKYRIESIGAGILTTHALSFDACIEALPAILIKDPEVLLAEMKTSGLRGRGGAGFPMAIKLDTVRKENADQKYIVCNADEGDPGAFSDRYLLEETPQLVLTGMAIAGYISGATDGVVYIRAEYPESIEICREAAAKINALFPMKGHQGQEVHFRLKVVKAQGAYICGEETALLNSLEGQRPEVRTRPPFPAQYGLFGKPTAVNNVETLASIPFIMTEGGAAYKNIGTERSSGTKLLSLDSHFKRPGLYEVDMGTPLQEAVDKLGGGFKEPVKALHIGGPLGGIVPMHKVPELTIDFESFSQGGFLLGHASILSIPERFPLVKYLEHLFEFTAHESCGKCFPCRLGSVRGMELLQKAQNESYTIDRTLWHDLLETLEKGSLCALGGGIPLPVKNAMQYFDEELKPHFS
jgi:NADH-quinone oxidoreductase subunit F